MKEPLIYFIECPEAKAFKIGYTTSLTARYKTLETSSPYDLYVRAVIPNGTTERERQLHNWFIHDWMRGEWFKDSEDLREFIASNTSTGAPFATASSTSPCTRERAAAELADGGVLLACQPTVTNLERHARLRSPESLAEYLTLCYEGRDHDEHGQSGDGGAPRGQAGDENGGRRRQRRAVFHPGRDRREQHAPVCRRRPQSSRPPHRAPDCLARGDTRALGAGPRRRCVSNRVCIGFPFGRLCAVAGERRQHHS